MGGAKHSARASGYQATSSTSASRMRELIMQLHVLCVVLATVAVLCNCQQDPLTTIIEDKERIVNELAEVALQAFGCGQNK